MRKLNIFLAVLVSLFIVACDTDDNTLLDPVPGGGGGGGSGVFLVDMGSGAGTLFVPDIITVATPILSSGDSTTLDVSIVDTLTTNTPYQNEVVAVTFTSLCLTAGTADLQVGGVSTNPISSQTGFIQATYVVQGCSGPDVITANATLADGTALTAVGTVTVSAAVDMGNGTGAGFVPDVISIAVPNLSAGGSTGVDVTIVDTANAANTLYGAEVINVTFSSLCLAGGTADIQVLGISTNPVSTATGLLSPTYVAQGCNGADVVTAAATLADGTPLTATGTVTIAPAAVGSISFLSAVPQLIGLRGTGGQGFDETSVVKFKVVDAIGAAVVGADVTFTLGTTVGGITVLPATATSDNAGEVQTVVTSGTVATSVRVTATVVGTMIATQSSVLVISTGLPDQDSFSWAVSCPNIEAWNYDGVENDVTVILSDRFQNPVPDGTAISFNAEGGSIESNCQTNTPTPTRSGTCTVTWTSAEPRPLDGRVQVMAHAIGEESFIDVNSNGFFDDADSFTDLAEIYRDDNEINGVGVYDAGEFFFDFDADATYDTGNALFDGLLCGGPLGVLDTLLRCSTSQTTGIGKNGIIIMSGSAAVIADNLGGNPLMAPGAVTFTIGDLHNQPMPAGTTVKLTTGNGTIIGPSNLPVPCTSFDGPLNFSFFIDADSTTSSGIAVLEVETPGPGVGAAAGVITVYFIDVDD